MTEPPPPGAGIPGPGAFVGLRPSLAAGRRHPRASLARLYDYCPGGTSTFAVDRAAAELAYAGEWGAEDPALAGSDGSRVRYCGVARCP